MIATVCGLVGSLSKMFSVAGNDVPVLGPGGANFTEIVHACRCVSITAPFKQVLVDGEL